MDTHKIPVSQAKEILQGLDVDHIIGVVEDEVRWRHGDKVIACGVMSALACNPEDNQDKDMAVLLYPDHPQPHVYIGSEATELFSAALLSESCNIKLTEGAAHHLDKIIPDEERRELMKKAFTPKKLSEENGNGDGGEDDDEDPPIAAESEQPAEVADMTIQASTPLDAGQEQEVEIDSVEKAG